MSKTLPPLDMHAHIDAKTPKRKIEGLGAVVFAASRSLEEYESVLRRDDQTIVWGVGCHPSVSKAHASFDTQRFAELIQQAAFVGEVGLDGNSEVSIIQQEKTFRNILNCLAKNQRIVSIHSKGATKRTLQLLKEQPIKGTILHWWCGSNRETTCAIELGCWFSVNASARDNVLASIPLDRIFVETDHPYGNLRSKNPRQPGYVLEIEQRLANLHNLSLEEIRNQIWFNFVKLAYECKVEKMMTKPISRMIEYRRAQSCQVEWF